MPRGVRVGRQRTHELKFGVPRCEWLQRGHLRVGYELSDGHGVYVLSGIGVQRGHLRVEHELCDKFGLYVSSGIGVAGVVRTFRWDVIY